MMKNRPLRKKLATNISRSVLPGVIVSVVCGALAAFWLWEGSRGDAIVCLTLGIAASVLSLLLPQIPVAVVAARLEALARFAIHARKTGSIRVPGEIRDTVRDHDYGDEISAVSKSMIEMLDFYMEKVAVLEQVAQGDLSTRVAASGEEDTLGNAINDVLDNTSRIVREVKQATAQFSVGVRELANGAQSLAQSSSEQASTVDQLQISVGDVASEADANAAKAVEASKLTDAIRESASGGRRQLESMAASMREIAAANHSIGSVMRTIDDIAFQTNILALNAAVEAARAGVHGRGFAVVADEVRNLANKSSKAAGESNAVITGTIAKSDEGLKVVEDALAFFRKIEDGIVNTSSLLDEIAVTAKNQSDSIDTINTFISNLIKVVLLNNATSEQSAAASVQMSSRANILEETVNRFKLIDDRGTAPNPVSSPVSQTAPASVPDLDSLAGRLSPVNEPAPKASGRTPAEIYAEALGKKTPEPIPTVPLPKAPEAPAPAFKDDESKYW